MELPAAKTVPPLLLLTALEGLRIWDVCLFRCSRNGSVKPEVKAKPSEKGFSGLDVVGFEVVGLEVVGLDDVGFLVVGLDVVGLDVLGLDVVGFDVVGFDVVGLDVVGLDVDFDVAA
jgi:hypothetical protein